MQTNLVFDRYKCNTGKYDVHQNRVFRCSLAKGHQGQHIDEIQNNYTWLK